MLSDQTIDTFAVERSQPIAAGKEMDRGATGGSAGRPISREHFVSLVVRYERRVRVFISTLHAKWSDVDEIVQDACLVAWKKLDTFQYRDEEPDEEFVRWLCTIARYEVSKYRRKGGIGLLFDEDVIDKLTALQHDKADYLEARHEALQECIKKLRNRDRELIRRRYQEETSARELAKRVGRSIDAVYKSLSRIRGSLLACIERVLKREGYI